MRKAPLLLGLLLGSVVAAQQRPNIIYLMSDDHDNDAISAYNKQFIQTPNIDRLAKEGMRFTKAFVGNSICSPARATLLTGQHSHKNGVKDNRTRFDSSKTTIAHLLSKAGYQTALIGKWHLHSYPAGFDYWKILPGMGQYFDTRMITMNGDTITEKGYSADVLTDNAINWLSSRNKSKPFALFFHHKAPHRNFVPALKHLEKFSGKVFPEPATLYNDTSGRGSAWRQQTMNILTDMRLCGDLKIDPEYLKDIPELKPDADDIATYRAIMRRMPEEERGRFEEIYAIRGKLIRDKQLKGKELLKYKYQWYMQDYLACIASIDESIGRLLSYLDENGVANKTMVIYTSDQGFYLGENGWFDKRFAYDVSMQTPLIVRWPGKISPAIVSPALVQNIDFAPTILDIANVKIPTWMQGLSLKAVLTGKEQSLDRKYLYYHYYEFVRDHTVLPHLAIRGERHKLIYFYTVGEWEFYDLQKDPGEQKNLIGSRSHQKIIQELKAELIRLRDQYDDHEPAGELN
ncbi:MAG TPA: sulfatase [Chitinophagaceae bacterium]|nr:sulfatase [Chitinophagaceae bacterium]